MEIAFGNSHIETEDKTIAVSVDRTDTCILVLGINRVEVKHVNGSWTIKHSSNIDSVVIPTTDPGAIIERNVDLRSLVVGA